MRVCSYSCRGWLREVKARLGLMLEVGVEGREVEATDSESESDSEWIEAGGEEVMVMLVKSRW